jgi:hypothetical protein
MKASWCASVCQFINAQDANSTSFTSVSNMCAVLTPFFSSRPQAICYPCPYGLQVTPWTWACHNACQAQTFWRVAQYGPEEVATVVIQSNYRSTMTSRKALRMKLPRVEVYLMRILYQQNRLELLPSDAGAGLGLGASHASDMISDGDRTIRVVSGVSGTSLCSAEDALAIVIRVPTVVLRSILRFAFVPTFSTNTSGPASGAGIKNEFTRSYRNRAN